MDHLTGQQASQKQIQDFVQLCKEFKLSINKTFPIEKSFVTGGGVSLKEIHPKTLEVKSLMVCILPENYWMSMVILAVLISQRLSLQDM
ncbi:NAD(P)/FAD-dependent oxidoreductase [Enterococcus faecium]|nr:NAD(P)/FAD-dependent oxidoreductase [Enterococcus faecium]